MSIFKSFYMGGFECADLINRSGIRVNLHLETNHNKFIYQDYKLLEEAGIMSVREGICWSLVEKSPGKYDFSEVLIRMKAAQFYGIQQIWDICHFGYPDDLIPTHPGFSDRFVNICAAFTRFFHQHSQEILYVVPINEISFLSWHSGDMRGTVPFAINSGFDIKYHLCKAAIKGIEAIKYYSHNCRIVMTEPLIKIHADYHNSDPERIRQLNEEQFQAMDIISGRMCPELGGREEYLDILGLNYYYNNQWTYPNLPIHWMSEEYTPLSDLLQTVSERYQRPMFIAETGHFGAIKDWWIRKIHSECMEAMDNGIDLQGICIYPVIDRPDWDDLGKYCQCGILDLNEARERVIHTPYLNAIIESHQEAKSRFQIPIAPFRESSPAHSYISKSLTNTRFFL